MDSKDFHTIAQKIYSELSEPEEAILRTVVGRAYYSVYLKTRDWIDQKFPEDLSLCFGKSHERYTNCLIKLQQKHMDLRFSKFSRELKGLKDQRHFADYEVGEEDILGKVNTEMALLLAEQLLNDLDLLINKYS
ncbi:hypothetical protein R4446_00035 [Acinetobacter baumannii]|nr:hypothetical protein [Acinetobacter baumannii]MDV7386054.1 hypothetical protein [Acinetobacter baumannii]